MTVESLNKVFLERLNELFQSHRLLAEAYPRLAEAACSYKVVDLLEEQGRRSREAMARLEEVYALLQESPARGRTGYTRESVREAYAMVEEEMDLEVIDAGLLDLARRMQRHVAEACKSVAEMAQVLGIKAIPGIIHDMLAQEETSGAQVAALAGRRTPRHALAV